jgi:hypothetical protein
VEREGDACVCICGGFVVFPATTLLPPAPARLFQVPPPTRYRNTIGSCGLASIQPIQI